MHVTAAVAGGIELSFCASAGRSRDATLPTFAVLPGVPIAC